MSVSPSRVAILYLLLRGSGLGTHFTTRWARGAASECKGRARLQKLLSGAGVHTSECVMALLCPVFPMQLIGDCLVLLFMLRYFCCKCFPMHTLEATGIVMWRYLKLDRVQAC